MQKITLFSSVLATAMLLVGCQSMPMTTKADKPHHPKPMSHQPVFYGSDTGLPFSEAVKVGHTLYLSGQIGLKDGKLVQGGVGEETKQIFDNINDVLVKNGYQKSDLVKCTAMLKDMKQFSAFNQAYKAALNAPFPARSAFGVSDLALGSNVEVECIASK